MNKKQAVYLILASSIATAVYAIVFFWDEDIPFWKAYLISMGAVAIAIVIVTLLVGAVKLYERLEDKKEAL